MANTNMSGAQKTQRSAHMACDDSFRTHRQCLQDNLSQYHSLHQTFQKKASDSRHLSEVLQRRIKSVTASIDKNKQSLSQLERAHHQKNAPLQLCNWRMDQRRQRPHREHIRDPFELALEEECSTLTNAQADLKLQMDRTQRSIQELNDSLQELQYDLGVKMHSLQIDEQCMRTTHKPWQKQPDRSGSRPGPKTSERFRVTNTGNEETRQTETSKRDQIAIDKERAAQSLREESAHIIEQCQVACDQAKNKMERSMQERISETQNMRKRLENEIKETSVKIDRVKLTTQETKTQMRSLVEPMQLNDTRDSWRKQRAYREQIMDPVSTQMVEHHMFLNKAHESLEGRRREEKRTQQELEMRKTQLQEDLKDKTRALHIDLDCLSHTIVSQGGHNVKALASPRFKRSLKMEPNFAPASAR